MPAVTAAEPMGLAPRPRLRVYRHMWGLEGPWQKWLPAIKAAGYAGVEGMPPSPAECVAFRAALDALGMEYVAQIVTGWPQSSRGGAQGHFKSFCEQVRAAQPLRPLFFNSHSGVDLWPLEESRLFLDKTLRWQEDNNIDVGHETHRGGRRGNGSNAIGAARAPHHARVGYEQGPQVTDPRAPEFERQLQVHERWWKAIWDARIAAGDLDLSLTPEFGPPDYQHTLPFSRTPLADPWEVSLCMAQRQSQHFALAYGSTAT